MIGALQTLVGFSMCWLITSSLVIYPHSLSYFIESIGGPLNGPKHLLGSNVDWGQDLRYAIWYRAKRVWEPARVRLAYDGFFDPMEAGHIEAARVSEKELEVITGLGPSILWDRDCLRLLNLDSPLFISINLLFRASHLSAHSSSDTKKYRAVHEAVGKRKDKVSRVGYSMLLIQ